MIERLRALIVVITLLAPSTVFAETAVLLPTSGDEALKEPRAQAHQVLLQALQAQAIRVLLHADVAAGSTALAECKTVDCASALLEASGADVAVAVGVWAAAADARPSTVFVTLADRRGDRYPGKVSVQDDDLALAVKEALLEARALQLLGPGPWLRVRGEPRGAEILLNDTLIGTLPYRQPIEAGRHTLQVRYEGYRSFAQTIDVPPSTAKQLDIDVTLQPRDATASSASVATDTNDTRASKRPVVGPLLLGGAGAVLVGVDVAMILSSGCDRREPDGSCTKNVEINYPAAITFGVVGLGAIAGAVLWYLLAEDDADTANAGVRLSLRRPLGVSGSFGGL